MSSTPIFDQLAAELLEEKGVRYESLTATAPVNLRPVPPRVNHLSTKNSDFFTRARQYRQEILGTAFSQPLPPERKKGIDLKKKHKYAGPNLKLMYVDEMQIVPEEPPNLIGDYVQQVMAELRVIHPNALIEDMSVRMEDDGSATMVVKGVEPVSVGEDIPETLYMPRTNGEE